LTASWSPTSVLERSAWTCRVIPLSWLASICAELSTPARVETLSGLVVNACSASVNLLNVAPSVVSELGGP
jgi:hypothetical protein